MGKTLITPKEMQIVDPYAWAIENHLVTENGEPLEFVDHRFLIAPWQDLTKKQVTMKCAQIGWSTLAIFKEFWLARYQQANIIHTLPTKTVTRDFVKPKVNPIIKHNLAISEMMDEIDNMTLKKVSDRHIYFRGSFDQTQAISISAHALLMDEYDRSDQLVLETYLTRLGDACRSRPDLGYVWAFSNPSAPKCGVHRMWEESDQKVWMVRCDHCEKWQEMLWPESVDLKKKIYVCRFCAGELTDDNRRGGGWVAKHPGREISGYHISKLIVPWISASEMIEASEGDTTIFHNFWLGLPYISPDIHVSREAIIKAIVLTENKMADVVIGVDNGVMKHYVIGNRYGIFRVGKTESWEEIEMLHNHYDAITVIDALPYPTYPRRLAKKYRGGVFLHYFRPDTKNLGVIRWGEGKEFGKVLVDRTGILDQVANDIVQQKIIYNLTEDKLEEYIKHWEAIYRTSERKEDGRFKINWLTQHNRPDHFCFATECFRVGMEKRRLGSGGPFKTRKYKDETPESFAIQRHGFGDDIRPYSPGYDLDKLRRVLDNKARRKRNQSKLFSPPKR